jgi:ABC-type transport system involved in multi-copper enzyme maturation permease subunit
MNQALVIARRELVERRFVLLAAVAFALLSVVIPFVPGLHTSPRDTITIGSLVLAMAFTFGVAAILGATIVGSEITAGRMSFYFARPVGAPSIWLGKLAAALLLILSSFLIVVLPALLIGSPIARVWNGDIGLLLFSIADFAAILFFLFHAVGTMIRSRSGLIGFDFAAAAITAVAVWMIAGPLVVARAQSAAGHLYRGMIYGALFAAAVAGVWQLVDGRTDRRRSHVAFSKAFWSLIFVVLLGGAAFVAWIVSVRLSDVLLRPGIRVTESPRGDWATVSGEVANRFDYRPTFLLNLGTGAAERLRQPSWRSFFSRDGKKLIALAPLGKAAPNIRPGEVILRENARATVVVRDLATGRQMETNFPTEGFAMIEANDDASRLAIAGDGLLTVYDVAADRSLMSVRLAARPASMSFGARGLTIYTVSGRPQVLTAYVLDAASRSLRKTGELTLPAWEVAFSPSSDGTRLLVAPTDSTHFLIVDGQTLQTLGAVAATPGMQASTPMYLSDGRIAFGESSGNRVALRVIGADGMTKSIDLGVGSRLGISREVAPGRVIVATQDEARVVDIDRGVVVRRVPGVPMLMSGSGGGSWWFYPRAVARPGVLLTTKHGLLSWNALTGETKTLIRN